MNTEAEKSPLYSEIDRLRAVNDHLLEALRSAHSVIEAVLPIEDFETAYCPRCGGMVRLIDDGETCAQCKLVL